MEEWKIPTDSTKHFWPEGFGRDGPIFGANRQHPTADQSTKHWPMERNQKEFPSGPRRPEAVAGFNHRLLLKNASAHFLNDHQSHRHTHTHIHARIPKMALLAMLDHNYQGL